jgi:peroxiredoxin
MAALQEGTKAPEFSLTALDGSAFSLGSALRGAQALVVFFKVSCPVCQYMFPFFERLQISYGSAKVATVGISQDNKAETAAFLRKYGASFPALLEDPANPAASNAYGIGKTPTWFLIAQDGEIRLSSEGWVRTDVEDLNRRIAEANRTSPRRLFRPGEGFPEFGGG